MSPIKAVIANRNFRNLWLGQIISQIAVNMMGFILMIQIYERTLSNTAVSGMLFAIGLPAIFFGVIAGGVVDQFDKRMILVVSNLIRGAMLFVLFFMSESVAGAYVVAFLFSLATQFFIPAEAPSIPNLVSADELLPANSLFTFSFYASTITGFILSGPFLKIFGSQNIFIFLAFLMMIAAYFVSKIPGEKKQGEIELSFSKIGRDIDEGFRFIRKNKRVGQSMLLMTFSQALLAVLAALAPGFADKTLKIILEDSSYLVMGPAAIGLIMGALGVGTWGKHFLKGMLIRWGILGTGITLILLSLLVRVSHGSYFMLSILPIPVGGLEIAVIILFVLGFTNALISVPASTVLQEATEGALMGRIYGVLTSLTGGAAILPAIFSGILADAVGIGKTIFVIGSSVLLFGIYRLLKVPKTSINIVAGDET